MKLIRFGEPGKEKPGVLLKDGIRVDASAFGSDYDEAFFGGGGLTKLDSWLGKNASSAPRVAPSVRLGSPVCRPSKIVCIGLNYRDHAAETKAEAPKEPVLFFKATTSLVGPNDDLVRPRNARPRWTGRLSWRSSSGSEPCTCPKSRPSITSRAMLCTTTIPSAAFSWSAEANG